MLKFDIGFILLIVFNKKQQKTNNLSIVAGSCFSTANITIIAIQTCIIVGKYGNRIIFSLLREVNTFGSKYSNHSLFSVWYEGRFF